MQRLIDDKKLTPEEFFELAREFTPADDVRPSAPGSRRKTRGRRPEGDGGRSAMSHSLFLPVAGGSTIWGLVLDLSLKVTVLYLVAMLLHLLLGRRRPLSRSGLWNAILAGLIVLPVATLAFPRLQIDFPQTPASDLVESQQANDATTKPSSLAIGSRIDDLAATFEGDRAPGRVGARASSALLSSRRLDPGTSGRQA